MSEVLYIVASFVNVLISILIFAIFIRAILSWFPIDEDGPIVSFVYLITDPVIVPIRALLERFSLFEGSPIDFSSFIAMLLLMLLETLLGFLT